MEIDKVRWNGREDTWRGVRARVKESRRISRRRTKRCSSCCNVWVSQEVMSRRSKVDCERKQLHTGLRRKGDGVVSEASGSVRRKLARESISGLLSVMSQNNNNNACAVPKIEALNLGCVERTTKDMGSIQGLGERRKCWSHMRQRSKQCRWPEFPCQPASPSHSRADCTARKEPSRLLPVYPRS